MVVAAIFFGWEVLEGWLVLWVVGWRGGEDCLVEEEVTCLL